MTKECSDWFGAKIQNKFKSMSKDNRSFKKNKRKIVKVNSMDHLEASTIRWLDEIDSLYIANMETK